MPSSMTGFAEATVSTDCGTYTWVIKSVNQRFLDASFRLPDNFTSLELVLRSKLKENITRGKVEVALKPACSETLSALSLNVSMAEQLQKITDKLSQINPNLQPASIGNFLQVPGLISSEKPPLDNILPKLLQSFDKALLAFVAARKNEGVALTAILKTQVNEAKIIISQLHTIAPGATKALEDKLKQRFLSLQLEMDNNRLNEELVYMAQKTDVTEELDRLTIHLTEIENLLKNDMPCGRKLDFILQELNREANTLGAKIPDIEGKNGSIELKVLIEKMKEQVQNIE